MKSISRAEWIILSLILIYSFIPSVGGLVRVFELAGAPSIMPKNPRALTYPFPIALHILSSSVFCILGALQFLPSIRHKHRAAHRALGRIVVVAGCISAASGTWMTHFFTFPEYLQGSSLYWVRMILGPLMIGFIIWAICAIRLRKWPEHRAMMLRAYAIGQGAATQTFFGISWMVIVGSEAVGAAREAMMVSAWGLNLLVAEIAIWWPTAKKVYHSKYAVVK